MYLVENANENRPKPRAKIVEKNDRIKTYQSWLKRKKNPLPIAVFLENVLKNLKICNVTYHILD
jgi:hypothetical protein